MSLKVISDTFNREVKHRLEVRGSPARISVKKKDAGFMATIRVDPSMLRTETVSIQLKLPDGEAKIIPQSGELEWSVLIPGQYENQEVTATLVGSRFNGKDIRMDLKHKLGEAEKADLKVELPEEVVKNSATASVDELAGNSEEESADEEELNWTNAGGVFIGVNVLVIGTIVFLVIMLKKRRAKKGKSEPEEEFDTEL